MDAERAHDLTLKALELGLASPRFAPKHNEALKVQIAGITFPSPVGLAAGFDKNARAIAPLIRLGFGFIEVGTITPRAQTGNPRPRLFRLENAEGVINRFGFNGEGMEAALARLRRLPRPLPVPLGINIGANKTTKTKANDYATAAEMLAPHGDYVTVNVSSPNTPGLRGLQDRDSLLDLLTRVLEKVGKRPVFLKIAPDMNDQALKDIVDVAVARKLAALIISNTTLERPEGLGPFGDETGGLSGRPLFDLSTGVLKNAAKEANKRIPLIGVGGISSADDVIIKLKSGASLVQLYSALVFKGPQLVRTINRDLTARLKSDGLTSITEWIGANL